MTLFDKWKLFMSDVSSPDDFIEVGFYYLISAALQRRVWVGPPYEGKCIFPNMYVILCGEPGVGKGLVIKPVARILKFHKISGSDADASKQKNIENIDSMIEKAKAANTDPAIIEQLYRSRDTLIQANAQQAASSTKKERLLIPVAADSTTYESLIQVHAASVSKINVPPCTMAPAGYYAHHSLCFALEEISSLFRKKQDAIVNYMLAAYDCGDYTYETKNSGTDRVRKCCLSFFGGTTPGFMKSTFDEKLLTDGFSSRTIFVYGGASRKFHFMHPAVTTEQINAERDIIARVKELSTFFGQVVFDDDAQAFLDNYFQNVLPNSKTNNNDMLRPYYARKNIHVAKMCMAMHFADNNHFNISLDTAKRVLNLLDRLELSMHQALSFTGRNPLSTVYDKVARWIGNNDGCTLIDIWKRFISEMDMREMEECVSFLVKTDKVSCGVVGDEMRYHLKKKI